MSRRRKVMVTTTAVFTIGVAFAAQPTSLRADWGEAPSRLRSPWAPGTNALMSDQEQSVSILPPPQ